jgi:ABC-type antimicrobial peptide transport system permease subunit
LSAIGIYGVLAYAVTQRTREFGIRMALGARVEQVLSMVLSHGMRLAAIGLLIGVAGAIALTQLMTTLLFEVKPLDPGMYLLVCGALLLVTLAASSIPSVRAMRVHPASALRSE